MTMFETMKEKAAKLFGIEHTDFATVSHAVYSLVEQNGGIPGLQAKFRAAGLGEIFDSWSGAAEKLSITAEQVQKVFGTESLKLVAEKEGIPESEIAPKLAEFLPKIIDSLTPAVKATPEANKM